MAIRLLVYIKRTSKPLMMAEQMDAGAGDFIFQDTDDNGVLNDDDRVFLGSPIPDFEYGLNFSAEYRNFDVSLFFNGISGNEILNANIYRGYFDTEGNYLADAVNAWTPENPNTNIPRNTLLDPALNSRMSDFLLESGSYFRLRNFQNWVYHTGTGGG